MILHEGPSLGCGILVRLRLLNMERLGVADAYQRSRAYASIRRRLHSAKAGLPSSERQDKSVPTEQAAQVLHGALLGVRLANALHPGVVSTRFGAEDPGGTQRLFVPFMRPLLFRVVLVIPIAIVLGVLTAGATKTVYTPIRTESGRRLARR